MKFILYVLTICLVLTFCKKDKPDYQREEILLRFLQAATESSGVNSTTTNLQFTAFYFLTPYSNGKIEDNAISIRVTSDTDVTALVAYFSHTASKVTVNGTEQTSGNTSNDFSSSVVYTLTSSNGTTKEVTVTVTKGL